MAYAALMTLSKAIDLIMPHHEDYIFLCDREQMQSLKDKVIRLQEFLENVSWRPSWREPLEVMEGRIRETAYQLEDIVESILVGSFHQYFATEARLPARKSFYQVLASKCVPYCGTSAASIPVQEALDDTLTDRTIATFASCIGEIDVLLKDSMEMKKDINTNVIPGTIFSSTEGSSSSEPRTSADTKVGLKDDLNKVLDHITSNVSPLQTIFITGMGGIGKTTLARAVFELPGLQRRFDLRLWVTVSQEWNIEEILQCLLAENGGRNDHENGGRNDHVESLIESVYKMLYGRRYLIVLDDVWDEDVLGKLKRAFLDQKKGSRVIVTTRLLKLGQYVTVASSQLHQMKLLSDEQSWNLLREKVSGGNEHFHVELESIGRAISRNCKGLPLAVIVIGGILKSKKTKDYWEEVAKLTTVGACMGDKYLLEILSLSYTNLPPHLKACFLYFGMFREDKEIETDELVRLWSAEGFLKSRKSKTMEEVAEECLEELVERSLVLVKERNYNGKIKTSSIHDVLRDFSLTESKKENFLHYSRANNIDPVTYGKIIKEQRRVSFLNSLQHLSKSYYTTDDALVRSFIHEGRYEVLSISFIDLKLLRVLHLSWLSINEPLGNLCSRMTNLRYLQLNGKKLVIPSSISKLRNLETLIIDGKYKKKPIILPLEIWNMPRLRHFIVDRYESVSFPEPSLINGSSLESLHTLEGVTNECLTMSVINKMLNLRSLRIIYAKQRRLDNLVHLHNLQHLYIYRSYNYSGPGLTNFVFPQKLKELSLDDTRIPWKKMASIGELPHLEWLDLRNDAFVGEVWEPSEGGFCQLKYLSMSGLDLEEWRAESTHFPSLEELEICFCDKLKEVPGKIGEIDTLKKLTVIIRNNESLKESVERIKDEQYFNGNDSLEVIVPSVFLGVSP